MSETRPNSHSVFGVFWFLCETQRIRWLPLKKNFSFFTLEIRQTNFSDYWIYRHIGLAPSYMDPFLIRFRCHTSTMHRRSVSLIDPTIWWIERAGIRVCEIRSKNHNLRRFNWSHYFESERRKSITSTPIDLFCTASEAFMFLERVNSTNAKKKTVRITAWRPNRKNRWTFSLLTIAARTRRASLWSSGQYVFRMLLCVCECMEVDSVSVVAGCPTNVWTTLETPNEWLLRAAATLRSAPSTYR